MGLVITIVLAVGCVFLFRSMLAHLRRVPPTFDELPADTAEHVIDPRTLPGR